MLDEILKPFLRQLELLHEENKLIIGYLGQLAGKLDRFTIIMERLLVPSQPKKIKIGRLSGIKGVKKIIIKQVNVQHLDCLEFNLDSVAVEELSGILNIGISEAFNVKATERIPDKNGK